MTALEKHTDAWENGYLAIKHILQMLEREDLTNAQKVRASEFISKYSIIRFHSILNNDNSSQTNREIDKLTRPLLEEYNDVLKLIDK